MRCLYCSQHLEEKNLLKKHYENNHKVDINNWVSKALLKQRKVHFFSRKCYRCERLLTSEREEKKHNFLFHFQKRGTIPLEDLG